jgi:hypothetical protein
VAQTSEPVTVHLAVTNRTPAGCGLLQTPNSSLAVVAATRDGQPFAPTVGHAMTVDGASLALAGSATTMVPDATVPIDPATRASIDTVTPLHDVATVTIVVGDPGSQTWFMAEVGVVVLLIVVLVLVLWSRGRTHRNRRRRRPRPPARS